MKTLRIAQKKVKLSSPEYVSDQGDTLTLMHMVYEPLVRLCGGKPMPALLSSWVTDDGGRTWALNIRSDARFGDGRRCTAEDVSAALGRLKDASGPFGMQGPYAPYVRDMEISVMGEKALRLRCPEPNGSLPDLLAGVFVGEGPDDGKLPVGTGPLRVIEYVPDSKIVLEPKGSFDWDRVQINAIEESDARLRALRDGAVDLASGLGAAAVFRDLQELCVHRRVNTLSVIGFLNGFSEPFDQPRARLAVNLAVDVQRIIEDVCHGMAVAASTAVSPDHLGYPSGLNPIAHDPQAAKGLFDDCRMPDQLVLRTPRIIPDRAHQVSQRIADDLDKVGLKVAVEIQQDRPRYALEVSQKKIGHMAIFDSSPQSTYRVCQEKLSSQVRGPWWQGVRDDTADELINSAAEKVSLEQRAAAYEEVLLRLHRNPHWLYLYHPVKVWAHRPGVTGAAMNAAGALVLNDMGS